MKTKQVIAAAALALGLAAVPTVASAQFNWVGSADYGVETVGPFDTYDFSANGALLLLPQSATEANGYYQSFVANHLLGESLVSNPALSNGDYEITVTANFTSSLSATGAFTVNSGSFALWLDTTPDRDFAGDSGFNNGVQILAGTIEGGEGFAGPTFGAGNLVARVTSYDTSVYSPDTILGGESAFVFRNRAVDQPFLNTITSVQGNSTTGGLEYAADGNLILTAIPEPESYALMLAGLGLIGFIARRRQSRLSSS